MRPMRPRIDFIRTTVGVWLCGAATAMLGCSNRPGRVATPEIGADEASETAIRLYDSDANGQLSKAELQKCPPLLLKLQEIDADGDQLLSANEIRQRVADWLETRVGFVTGYKCKVLENGRPLAGANVEIVPEEFLGDAIKPASGTSDSGGIASLAVAETDLPSDLHGLRGVQLGMYRVRITHPTKPVPKNYNKETMLACEIYPSGDPEMMTYDIRTK